MDKVCMFCHSYATKYMRVKFQSEHKYVLLTKYTIIFRLHWTTIYYIETEPRWSIFRQNLHICIFVCEFIVFRLKFLSNLLTWVQLTMSQCWLKLWLSVKQRHAVTWKKWLHSLLTQILHQLASMNTWIHSAGISAVFSFVSAVVIVHGFTLTEETDVILHMYCKLTFWKSLTGLRKSDNCRHSGGWSECSYGFTHILFSMNQEIRPIS